MADKDINKKVSNEEKEADIEADKMADREKGESGAADAGNQEAAGEQERDAADGGEVDDSEQQSEDGAKSKIFSRKDKKEKKDKKDTKIDELNDKLMRLMAEYDNYRKRTDKEKSMMFEMGAKSVIEKVLPVIDNFERGFDCLGEEQKEDAFVQGMDKIYKQFSSLLEEAGVTVIEAVGKEFDPNIHNAVMHIDDDALETNIVVEEFQKGYMYKESVVRCSMVKVAN